MLVKKRRGKEKKKEKERESERSGVARPSKEAKAKGREEE